jgi:hypothetical protein
MMPRLLLFLALAVLSAGCKPKRAPTPLKPSTWKGTMTYLVNSYPFTLTIEEVDADGDFRGSILWESYGIASPIKGVANGDHLVFIDNDRDEKDVRIAHGVMGGTDKNGSATFEARQEGLPAEPPPLPPPASPPPQGKPEMNPAWARQAAVCEGMSRQSWNPSLGADCYLALALASKDAAACARLVSNANACTLQVAALEGAAERCGEDEGCLLGASLHGAGEAACERLRDRAALGRCLAGVRKSPAACSEMTGLPFSLCLAHVALAMGDAAVCEQITQHSFLRNDCLRDVGVATHRFEVCQKLPSNPQQDTMGTLARTNCLERVADPPSVSDCKRRGSSTGEMSACLLQAVGNGAGPATCEDVVDAAMKAACASAAASRLGGRLHWFNLFR